MSLSLPSEEEVALCKSRVLYLGTTYFTNSKPDNDGNIKVNLKLIQDTISKRYPVNGEKYAEGIETWLSVYPSGMQIEHSKIEQTDSDALFFFPIKSLVYCGALRLINKDKGLTSERKWKFVPLDAEAANETKNLKNPPLFVSIVRGVDPSSKGENIECHVFVVRMKKTAMKLVECSQKAYNTCNQTVAAFRNKYGNVPAVFTSSDGLKGSAVVKKHDDNGFFYVINDALIDLWQLYESNGSYDEEPDNKQLVPKKPPPVIQQTNSTDSLSSQSSTDKKKTVVIENHIREDLIDPYEDAPNLVRVERTVDPVTGQNIYVRWLADDEPIETTIIETQRIRTPSPPPPPLVIRESQPTPEPVIVEKIVQKKKPQLIIKEIHVSEPSPPPIKVVEEIVSESSSSITPPKTIYKKTIRSPSRHKSRHRDYGHYIDATKIDDYAQFNNIYKNPDYYMHHRKKSRNRNYDFIYNNADVHNVYKKLYQPINDYYYSGDNYVYESPSNILFHHKPRRPHLHTIPPPVYAYHHHRRHYHHHRPPPQPEHHSRRHQRVHYNDQASNVESQRSKHSSKRSEVIKIKNKQLPPKPQIRPPQEPRKQYRKIIVMDDTTADESGQIKPQKKLQTNAPNFNQNNGFVYSNPHAHVKMRPRVINGYM